MASKATGKAGRSQSDPSSAVTAVAAATRASVEELKASHPGLVQGPYCGMKLSNTLFYPFLPALPSEVTIMKSGKIYHLVDRMHTAFVKHLQSPPGITDAVKPSREVESVFQLMQEAYKEEKPALSDDNGNVDSKTSEVARASVVGNAIGALRKSIAQLEVPKLAVDWYAVCALLQRQHDFLKLNSENMERWCKDNFSQTDYEAVYLEQEGQDEQHQNQSKKRKAGEMEKCSVLLSIGKREFRVKIHCTGFK